MKVGKKLKRKTLREQLRGELKMFEKWCEKGKITVDLKTLNSKLKANGLESNSAKVLR